jgi:hypothetical protein
MKVYLRSVKIGSYYDVTDEIGDFEIEGQLKSGKLIEIFDGSKIDLREFEHKEVDCLIWANIKRNIIFRSKSEIDLSDPSIIFGNYIKNYQIPLKWKSFRDGRIGRLYNALETDDGLFLFKLKAIENIITEKDKKFGLQVVRYDLLDYVYNE